jgi:hypothetical protein
MSENKASPESTQTAIVVSYPFTEAEIAAQRERFAAVKFDTPRDYAEGVKAIAECRTMRGKIEERRKDLKADSLAYGRKVDAIAKSLTALISSFEEPMQLKKKEIDDEKARQKAEAERLEREAIEAEIRQQREAEEARLREQREAEQRVLDEERKRLEADRAELARQRAEQEERDRKAREEREAAEKAERERVAAEQKAEAERLRAERARLDEEQRQREAAQREAEEKARRERDAEEARLRAEREAEEARLRAEREAIEAEKRKLEEARQAAERAEFERKAREQAEAAAREKLEREQREEAERQAAEAERREAEELRLEALKPDIQKIQEFAGALRTIKAPELSDHAAQAIAAIALTELGAIAGRLEAFDGHDVPEAAAE